MGLLSGLEQLGLGNLEKTDVFEKKEQVFSDTTKAEPVRDAVSLEAELLFEKTLTCPACGKNFKQKVVRSNKFRLMDTDLDLRPRYEHIDPLKYDVILCTHCGYAAIGRYFAYITDKQSKQIKESITYTFRGVEENGEIYTYEEALVRYKLALATAIVRHSKDSEKAFICLKAGWLVRGMAEQLDPEEPDYQEKKKMLEDEESEFLRNAMDGLIMARQQENYPICGMEKYTVE
ncbi:MAG: DUF2225 domain-containing protein, partial [Lachnospiraceae bacterium]|nr:DUF2225 domain-containing protein [Lachnospiraceae bacterium]